MDYGLVGANDVDQGGSVDGLRVYVYKAIFGDAELSCGKDLPALWFANGIEVNVNNSERIILCAHALRLFISGENMFGDYDQALA